MYIRMSYIQKIAHQRTCACYNFLVAIFVISVPNSLQTAYFLHVIEQEVLRRTNRLLSLIRHERH
jgi:hypothetical protein